MTPGAGGRGSAGPPGGGPEQQVASLLNGDEMKQSPASTHGGLNGGTPNTAGGPGYFFLQHFYPYISRWFIIGNKYPCIYYEHNSLPAKFLVIIMLPLGVMCQSDNSH